MAKTAIVFSPIFYAHDPGKDHPESASRLRAMVHELRSGRLSNAGNIQFVNPVRAPVEDVALVHAVEYIRLVKAVCNSGGGLLDLEDTIVSRKSYEVALYAVGGAIQSVDLVISGRYQNAFALIRPPGHHASKFRACGFCVFNNISIATEHLRRKHGLKRIAIVDIDAHHGNGTQETFYSSDQVLYVSLHEDPTSFPGTGFANEVGEGEGRGFTVNIPFPYQTGDSIYLRAVKEIVVPVISQFKPQFIMVSAGLDAHYSDLVGNLSLSTACYSEIFKTLRILAEKLCSGRLVSVLEGGYNVHYVGKTCASIVSEMIGNIRTPHIRESVTKEEALREGDAIVRKVKDVQEAFWQIS